MALSRSNINYEVHVLQKGRWEIHARYPDKREKAALDEAKELDTQVGIDAVRVVRESYNPIDGSSSDKIIYVSSGHQNPLSKSGGNSSSATASARRLPAAKLHLTGRVYPKAEPWTPSKAPPGGSRERGQGVQGAQRSPVSSSAF
jgi:hypothetical protein